MTIADVDLLDRQGSFDGYGKVELIDGELLYVNAQYRPHMILKDELAYRIRRALEHANISLFVGTEGSVALSEHDLPQPDILLTSEPDGEGAVPGHSVALLIEVADTTLSFDLGRKTRLYATAGIPEYWIADLTGRRIIQLWQPSNGSYAEHRDIAFGDPIVAATVDGLAVETSGLSRRS